MRGKVVREISRLIGLFLLMTSISVAEERIQERVQGNKPDQTGQEQKVSDPKIEVATLAGGCFWCLESPFDKTEGVISTVVGYSGGSESDASYEKVSSGSTEHLEAIQVSFDANKISYEKILEIFWKNIDPVDDLGQFCDKGKHYVSAIFPAGSEQKRIAEASKSALELRVTDKPQFKAGIKTLIKDFKSFYPAEDYHQDYYSKNPIRYSYYRSRCGRDQRLEELWSEE